MAVKRVEFLNREQNIRGVLYLHKKAPLIVLCHGFTSDKDVKLLVFLSKFLYNNGYSVFRFDFRGSGESGGEFTGIDAEISDLKQVMKFVKP